MTGLSNDDSLEMHPASAPDYLPVPQMRDFTVGAGCGVRFAVLTCTLNSIGSEWMSETSRRRYADIGGCDPLAFHGEGGPAR